MIGRPRLSRVLAAWSLLTIAACVCFMVIARRQPPDELAMANTWGFQCLVALSCIGFPAIVLLLAFLLTGSLVWSRKPAQASSGITDPPP
ncbi:MAG TPA: hypothetical protein VGC19_12275 [Rhodanobacter sp.]